MNQVSGMVFLRETNAPLSRLLVEVYDVDRDTEPTDIVHSAVPGAAVPWMRSAGYAPATVVEDQVGGAGLALASARSMTARRQTALARC